MLKSQQQLIEVLRKIKNPALEQQIENLVCSLVEEVLCYQIKDFEKELGDEADDF